MFNIICPRLVEMGVLGPVKSDGMKAPSLDEAPKVSETIPTKEEQAGQVVRKLNGMYSPLIQHLPSECHSLPGQPTRCQRVSRNVIP